MANAVWGVLWGEDGRGQLGGRRGVRRGAGAWKSRVEGRRAGRNGGGAAGRNGEGCPRCHRGVAGDAALAPAWISRPSASVK